MPRTARTISASGYYHIIARGIGKQVLFEEDADYLFFLRLMKNYSSSGEYRPLTKVRQRFFCKRGEKPKGKTRRTSNIYSSKYRR